MARTPARRDGIAYCRLLKSFFDYLKSRRGLVGRWPDLHGFAVDAHQRLSYSDEREWRLDIPYLRINANVSEQRSTPYDTYLLAGGQIRVDDSEIRRQTYSLCIVYALPQGGTPRAGDSCCLHLGSSPVLVRKIHFDQHHERDMTRDLGPRPRSHMQLGGRFDQSKLYRAAPGLVYHYCLDNELKVPRVPYPPLDLILFLDFVLRTFKTGASDEVKEQKWIEHLKDSVRAFLADYCRELHAIVGGHAVGSLPTRGSLYEQVCEL